MKREERHILWNTSATLMGMAMPAMLFGPAVMAVLLVLGVLVGLAATKDTSLRSTLNTLYQAPAMRLGAAVLVSYAVSCIFAIDPKHAFHHWQQLLGMAITAALLFFVLREMPTRYVEELLKILSVTLLVVIALVLADAFLNDERLSRALHDEKWNQVHRLNFMSSVLCVLLPFLWAWMIQNVRHRNKLAQWFALPVGLISFLAVFVAGGRAGWVAITLAAIVFLWVAGTRHHLTLHKRHWFMGAVAIALGPLAYGLSRGFNVMHERLNVLSETNGFGSGRLDIWQFAFSHFWDNPLTGIGLQGFRKLPLPPEGIVSNAHPHNFLIQLYLETGGIGLILTWLLIVYVVRQFWGYAQKNIYGLAALSGLVAFFTASLANTSIFQPWWLLFVIFTAVFGARIGWAVKR